MPQTLAHLFIARPSNNHHPRILHPSGLGLLLAVIILFNSTVRLVSLVGGNILGFATNIQVQTLLQLTNIERVKLGLNPLVLNPQLTEAALAKAADMFAQNYWAHVGPDGKQPWDFITTAGYLYRYAGENLARDFNDSDRIIAAWLASPTHRDNLINPNYQDIGLAVVNGKLNNTETTLVVQMFGQEESARTAATQGESLIPPVAAAERKALSTPSAIANLNQPTEPLAQLPSTQITTAPRQSLVSPFTLEKNVFLILFIVLMVIFLIDLYVAKKNQLVRLTGKNWGHIMYLAAIIVLILSLVPGNIL